MLQVYPWSVWKTYHLWEAGWNLCAVSLRRTVMWKKTAWNCPERVIYFCTGIQNAEKSRKIRTDRAIPVVLSHTAHPPAQRMEEGEENSKQLTGCFMIPPWPVHTGSGGIFLLYRKLRLWSKKFSWQARSRIFYTPFRSLSDCCHRRLMKPGYCGGGENAVRGSPAQAEYGALPVT